MCACAVSALRWRFRTTSHKSLIRGSPRSQKSPLSFSACTGVTEVWICTVACAAHAGPLHCLQPSPKLPVAGRRLMWEVFIHCEHRARSVYGRGQEPHRGDEKLRRYSLTCSTDSRLLQMIQERAPSFLFASWQGATQPKKKGNLFSNSNQTGHGSESWLDWQYGEEEKMWACL